MERKFLRKSRSGRAASIIVALLLCTSSLLPPATAQPWALVERAALIDFKDGDTGVNYYLSETPSALEQPALEPLACCALCTDVGVRHSLTPACWRPGSWAATADSWATSTAHGWGVSNWDPIPCGGGWNTSGYGWNGVMCNRENGQVVMVRVPGRAGEWGGNWGPGGNIATLAPLTELRYLDLGGPGSLGVRGSLSALAGLTQLRYLNLCKDLTAIALAVRCASEYVSYRDDERLRSSDGIGGVCEPRRELDAARWSRGQRWPKARRHGRVWRRSGLAPAAEAGPSQLRPTVGERRPRFRYKTSRILTQLGRRKSSGLLTKVAALIQGRPARPPAQAASPSLWKPPRRR